MANKQARILSIAGSDPSGGAGLQADIKTITALGGFATSVVTALTVQNTRGVSAVQQIAPVFIKDQISAVLQDIGADAIKVGMIGSVEAAQVVAETLKPYADDIPIVVDPVLIATSGDRLAGDGMTQMLRDVFAPLAAVLTPNADEAGALTGRKISDRDDLIAAGLALLEDGARYVLAKGAHLDGEMIEDFLIHPDGIEVYRNPRLTIGETHGTGCSLASAVATHLALGENVETAVAKSIDYVRQAIETASGFGSGAIPLNHAWIVQS